MFQRLAQLREKPGQVHRAIKGRLSRNARRDDDGGFILLESIVSIFLITVLMTAMTTFLTTTTQTTNHLRIRQEAIQLADSGIEKVRAYSPSALVSGRDAATVTTYYNLGKTNPVLKPVLDTITPTSDSTIPAPTPEQADSNGYSLSTKVMPVKPVKTVLGPRTFWTMYFLGTCAQGNTDTTCTPPATPPDPTKISYLRAVVAVTWTAPTSTSICNTSSCMYVTSTLINPDTDPIVPVTVGPIQNLGLTPGDQTNYVGDAVTVQFAPTGGAGSYTVSATGLPPGPLTMSSDGRVTGTVADPGANTKDYLPIITVWDGFNQTKTATFKWTIWRKPTINVPDQTTSVNAAVNLDLSSASISTCPLVTCKYSASALPGGLTLNATSGLITGAPTAAGTTTFNVTITDGGGTAVTQLNVTWTVAVAASVCPSIIGLSNGSFENPVVSAGAPNWLNGGTSPLLWNTTEPDKIIELWKNDSATGPQAPISAKNANGGQVVTAEDGSQWAELNANQTGALYQDIPTVPGQVLQWSVWHKGRYSSPANASKKDVMQVQIGTTTSQTPQIPTGQATTSIADGPTSWNLYRGFYTVPAGQTTTRFQFAAVSTASGDNSVGNFIDNLTLNNQVACVDNPPGDQTSTVNTAINSLVMTASRGSSDYTWSGGSTLPAGLTMQVSGSGNNTATITGTPTTVGTSNVAITLTDNQTAYVRTVRFTWVVAPKPTVTAPVTQRSSTGSVINLQLTTDCQNSPCSYGIVNSPAGLSVSNTGVINGTITSAPRTFNGVKVTVTDNAGVVAQTSTFSWIVISGPTVGAPGNQTSSVGTAVSVAVSTGCTNGPCIYALNNAPPGLSINGVGLITGTITGSSAVYSSVRVTSTDQSNVAVTSSSFSWTVNPAPKLLDAGNQVTARGATVTLKMGDLASGGTGNYTYSASGLPAWLSLDTTTGIISGTAPNADSVTTPITVTLTDATNVKSTTAAFTWTVSNALNFRMTSRTTSPLTAISLDLHTLTSGGTGVYSYVATGLPSWLSLSPTGVLSGTSPSVAAESTLRTSNISITVTDSALTTLPAVRFNWYVTDLKLSPPPSISTALGTYVTGYNAASWTTGGTGTLTYSATGLPPGLSMGLSGVLTGTVSKRGPYTVVLSTTDGVGATVSSTIAWTVT